MSVPAAGEDQRIAVYGALDYASGQVLWQTAAKKDGAGFAAFLEQIGQTWPEDDLVLVLDNVSYHRSAAMRTWWAAQEGRMLPFWLPAYCPEPQPPGARLALPQAEAGLPPLLGRSGRAPRRPQPPCSTRPQARFHAAGSTSHSPGT